MPPHQIGTQRQRCAGPKGGSHHLTPLKSQGPAVGCPLSVHAQVLFKSGLDCPHSATKSAEMHLHHEGGEGGGDTKNTEASKA